MSLAEPAGRCDGCVAPALVAVRLSTGGTLAFCGHDWKRHEVDLRVLGISAVNDAALTRLQKTEAGA